MKDNHSDIFHYLISHSGFRDWVLKASEENDCFWKKWLKEHPESISDLKKAREFIERMRFREEQLSQHELDDLLGQVIANEARSRPMVKETKLYLWSVLANHWTRVAAVLFISFVAAVVLKGQFKESPTEPVEVRVQWVIMENPKGRKSKVTLPDGTLVNLNYESRLRFPKVFDGTIRQVELTGEAFFNVAHNDTLPFVVQAGDLETEVLGTSFNIKSNEMGVTTDISLVTGKIKINNLNGERSKEEVFLSPGEQLSYDRHSREVVIKPFDSEMVTAWKDGVIIFRDAGLKEFVVQLEKWYGVDFQIYGSPSKEWKINGRYRNEKLDDILTGLQFVYGLDYKIQGKNVVLNLNSPTKDTAR